MEKTKMQWPLRIVLFYSVLILSLIIVGPTSAKQISLQTTITTEFVKELTCESLDTIPQKPQTPIDKLNVTAYIKNKGDETAFGVVPAIVFPEEDRMIGEAKDLPAGQEFTWRKTFDLEALGIDLPGTYTLLMLILFKDANGYPFSTPRMHKFNRDKASLGRIAIKPKMPSIDLSGKTATSIILRNTGPVEKEVSVSVLHAKEIASGIKADNVLLLPNARKEVPIAFENFMALPGTTALIYYVAQYENEGVHYCEVANNTIRVSDGKGPDSLLANSWLFVLAIVIVIAVYAALASKKKGKRVQK